MAKTEKGGGGGYVDLQVEEVVPGYIFPPYCVGNVLCNLVQNFTLLVDTLSLNLQCFQSKIPFLLLWSKLHVTTSPKQITLSTQGLQKNA